MYRLLLPLVEESHLYSGPCMSNDVLDQVQL